MTSLLLYRFPFTLLSLFRCRFRFRFRFLFPFRSYSGFRFLAYSLFDVFFFHRIKKAELFLFDLKYNGYLHR